MSGTRRRIWVYSLGLLAALNTPVSEAISVDDLVARLDSDAKITLIDIRNNALYKQAHIHNAINIPLSIIERKRLPPLGEVVVYGDGIDEKAAQEALETLNNKAGIVADALVGGFAAWAALQPVDHRQRGLDARKLRHITYQKLNQLVADDASLMLVDLRTGKTLTSLSAAFDNPIDNSFDPPFDPQRVIHAAFAAGSSAENIQQAVATIVARWASQKAQHLFVLIDDGDGVAETVAARLKAAGMARVVLLVGGEHALQAKGQITQKSIERGSKQ